MAESAANTQRDPAATVARILSQHQGADEAIPGEELARYLGVSHSTVRNYIDDVIRWYRLPVGNCEAGYFVVSNDDEFRRLMGQHESRRRSAKERMQALSQAYYGKREVWT